MPDWFIDHISAVTFAVRDMAESVVFYERLGFQVSYGGPHAAFTTMHAGRSVINLRHVPQGTGNRWARVILRVQGVDALNQHLRAQGLNPSPPKNAAWGERYCEISDPDGDVISFAELLDAID
jgi:catechol 2,3-dioxygenase-like lactoylglutathione lyase family enzyme